MDARFKIAVAGQHGRRDDVVGNNGFFDLGIERTGIADTGGAAVGRYAEAQLFQIGQQSGIFQIRGDYT